MTPAKLGYRPDVDGLRALAVLAVVAFHAFPRALPGGFVGVDVFFVISGYLISRIIVQAADAGSFSFLTFYAHRARRIFPALVLVLLATIILTSLALTPEDVERVGRHVVAGALFSSNLVLWHESGYFDAASATKPLLHLWSLGIEEQFYLIWPAILMLLARARQNRLIAAIAIGISSFVLGVILLRTDATAAFYSPASRAWELMIGATLGIAALDLQWKPVKWQRDAASGIGMMLVLVAMASFDARMPFPGWYALLPTIGAALLIGAGSDTWINRHLLTNRGAVGIGLISYPLYLWHWPLLVIMRRVTSDAGAKNDLATAWAISVVLISFAAAYATYRLLELPIRRLSFTLVSKRASLALMGTGMLGVLAMVWPVSNYGDDPDTIIAQDAHRDWHSPKSNDAVYFATKGSHGPEIVFIGDSHMEQYYPDVKQLSEAQSPTPVVAFSTHGGCAFLPTFRADKCGSAYARSMKLASARTVRRVVIASDWYGTAIDSRFDANRGFGLLSHDLRTLRQQGKEVIVIVSHPNAPEANPELLAAHLRVGFLGARRPTQFVRSFPLSEFARRTSETNSSITRAAGEAGATVIDPSSFLCPGGQCITTDEHGIPLRVDDNHLRPFAVARYLTYVPALVGRRSVKSAFADERGASARVTKGGGATSE